MLKWGHRICPRSAAAIWDRGSATGDLAIDFGNLAIARITNLDTGDDRQDRRNKNLGQILKRKDLKEEYFDDRLWKFGDRQNYKSIYRR